MPVVVYKQKSIYWLRHYQAVQDPGKLSNSIRNTKLHTKSPVLLDAGVITFYSEKC